MDPFDRRRRALRGLRMALSLAPQRCAGAHRRQEERPHRGSRAMGLHARTLGSIGSSASVTRSSGAGSSRIRSISGPAIGTSPAFGWRIWAQVSVLPLHAGLPGRMSERFLSAKLADIGVDVDWGASLVRLTDHGDHVGHDRRRHIDRARSAHSYVAGCDGAHSAVRGSLGIRFPGGSSEGLFCIADATVRGRKVENLSRHPRGLASA